jgi:hypothetical protein
MNRPETFARTICALLVFLFLLACDLNTLAFSSPSPTATLPLATSKPPVPTTASPTVVSVATPTSPTATQIPPAQSRGPITVVSPNGGEKWIVGEVRPIHWNWDGKFSSVRLEYSTDSGATWRTINATVTNDGASVWTVPNTPSPSAKIKITNTADPNAFDLSDADFAIVPPTITIARPNGGETYVPGETRPIHWNWTGKFSPLRIEYSTDSGATWRTINTNVLNDGALLWEVPNTLSSASKIKITDVANPNAFVVSNANFAIGTRATAPNPVTVTSPMGGDNWIAGREYYITWAPTQGIKDLKLEYSANGGATWNMIVPHSNNVGYSKWKIPSVACSNCKVKISDAANPSTFRESDLFTIIPQTLAITSPRAGDLWYAGRNYLITWNSSDLNQLKIEYSINDGATWNLLFPASTNSGYHTWTVPNTSCAKCKVRITNNDNPKVFDMSNAFEIR